MTKYTDIFSMVKSEENNYSLPVDLYAGYMWSMKDHIKTTAFYKNSKFLTGNDDTKPYKNIIRPILNLQYRTEGFDVKDIDLYVDEADNYFKSFLLRKYHDQWAREQGIDTFIDELVESYIDFGGTLVKYLNSPRPEVVPMQSIAFCDQTDILSGPIGIKHFFSPAQLKEMEKYGWGNKSNGATATLDEFITLSQDYKKPDAVTGTQAKTPGKYVEIYEVHGSMPLSFLTGEFKDQDKYEQQLHIIGFYQDLNGDDQGLTLFKGKEKKSPFKLLLRDKIWGRALGFGGAEELFEPQVWVNYSQIKKKDMLDAASKTILQTTDASFANRNKVRNMNNLETVVLEEGKTIGQVDTFPRNAQLFDKYVMEWEAHAQQMGAANDSIMGESPNSGTPFKLQELVVQQSQGLHNYRRGKIATFVDEIYRDWVIPFLARQIVKEQEFMASLELEELQQVSEALINCQANKLIKDKILSAQLIDPQEIEMFKTKAREIFMKGGNKRLLKILEGEFKDISVSVKTNIAGKQKYQAQQVDKLVNIFRQLISAPQVLQDPQMSKLFNEILENSGLSPIDFTSVQLPQQPISQPPAAQMQMPMAQQTNAV